MNSKPTAPSTGFTQARCNNKGLCWSDWRLKRNIELIGQLENGLGVYRFSYHGGDRLYVGVMAQDVARLVPEAVLRRESGFLQVDYRRLGLRLQTWSEWSALH